MMARAMALLAVLLVATAPAMIACAADPPVPAPTQMTTPSAGSAVQQSNGIATAAAQPPPTVTVQPVPTAAIAATPPPAANTPARPTPTPISQPATLDSPVPTPERFLIRLEDNLDDPLGYCIDVRGFGAGIRLDADLQAHSCKSNFPDDQSFAMSDEPPAGGIVLVDYDVCLAVAEPESGASILLSPCDDESVFRRFEWLDDGRVHLIVEQDASRPKLCIGVADGAGEPAGGRNHLRRDLMLLDCAGADLALIAWNEAPNQ